MKKKLYLGDSSEEEDQTIIYSEAIIREVIEEVPIDFLSSYILCEVSQSILENQEVLLKYILKKTELLNQ